MDCLFNFYPLAVGLVGYGFSPIVKMVAPKSFDVNKTTVKICRNEKSVSYVLFVIE